MGLFNKQPQTHGYDVDDYMMTNFKPSIAKDSYEHGMGLGLAQQSFGGHDPEVIIRLFSVDSTTKELIVALTGKYYDKETKKIIQVGTAHINEKGLREILPFIRGLLNNSVTKARLDNEIIEDFNFDVYLTMTLWLAKNRIDFGVKKDSILFLSRIITQFHYSLFSRALNGQEADNTLIHTLRSTDTTGQTNKNEYFSGLFKKSRLGR